jgi:hypothetical protein
VFHYSGARKKKSLTDLVKIVPFPDQGLRKRKQKAVKQEVQKPKRSFMQKPEPKVMNAPSGKLSSSSVSIKKLMNPDTNESGNASVDLRNMPMNDYSMDDLKMYWRRYAFDMKEQGKETFYNALIKRDPILMEANTYKMVLDGQTQIDMIKPILSELVGFIRASLKNYSIDVQLEITNNPEEEVKFKTGKDKFASLARKNPNLHTLKNTFNLDIEF